MNKVLVTGATGFIGRSLVPLLQQQGYKVRVLIRQESQAKQFSKDIEVMMGDINDAQRLNQACVGMDIVYHLAGLAHDNKSTTDEHLNINFYGTHRLIQAAIKQDIKNFIYFSSVKAEDSDTPYGIAKRKAEELLLHEAKSHDFHAVILRPALVYGPGCKGNLASMLRAIDKGYFIPIPETNNRRSLIGVNDVCKAAILVNSPLANGKIYTLSDGKDYSTRRLYENMSKALGKEIPKWHLPYSFFKLMAKCGDIITKISKIPMPFNSLMLEKMFGSAYYDSQLIRDDLNFQTNMDINHVLPDMINAYKGRTI